ncbi:rhodanese-related sulfurtransferase [Lentisphaera marina]|uniref:oxygen-dependent tRNA uridine(34) hydroxylase TrhO n=1 Tax=Lentisphaera marina TaxID=1111041 RepID=UPI00236732E2|nr:rhodanese-related sulfurtransferase [Lentisphaera marina]MDD7984069.1 rhodanese-related sulfurtransferase [Lentisphaera marina]
MYTVCALYKFVRLENYQEMREPLNQVMESNEVRGTLLLANEGINGTIAGPAKGIEAVLNYLNKDCGLEPIEYKNSFSEKAPFKRTKVKLKKEIVTMGVEGIDPLQSVGTYVKPSEWNELISDPEVVLVDTRNDYEVGIGTFQNALNPNTESFREFPKYVKENLDPEKNKKVAMFCTGGIRCEKSTAYLKEQGFEEVYHLQGGILKYLEEVPKEETMWEGECFVFDDRVAVNHDLDKGQYDMCHACRFPITKEDQEHALFEIGVSCPHCHAKTSEAEKSRFRERQHQMQLAEKRGEDHIGSDAIRSAQARQQAKAEKKRYDREQKLRQAQKKS